MSPRKVLLLTYHFPPSGAVAVFRMLGLARYLPKYGWQPVVVAPPRVPWEPEDASLLAEVPAETPVERVPFASGFFGKVWRYFAPESHWLSLAGPVCERMIAEHRAEAIFTSSPPGCVHLLGMSLHEQHRLPWLADFRDPWVTNDPLAGSFWLFRERWREARVMQRATVLIANTPRCQQGWAEAYPSEAHKMVTITNGFDPERFVASAEPRPATDRMTMLHAGELYGGRDPRPLLDALAALPSTDRPRVEFLGRRTEQLFDFDTEVARRNLTDCVQQHDQVAYEQAIHRMMAADILLLVHRSGYRLGVPAKLYEYLGAGR
ncbi:MAG: glycosyltransferase, partial [Planctomycetes bacterium]|nr:glycosyltransferase [Planctomycetota bacterium]